MMPSPALLPPGTPEPPIYGFTPPEFPQFRFEWHRLKTHAETQKPGVLYVIRVGTIPEHAEPFAWEIETHGDAYNAVLIWLRGYRHRMLEMDFNTDEERNERSLYVGLG